MDTFSGHWYLRRSELLAARGWQFSTPL